MKKGCSAKCKLTHEGGHGKVTEWRSHGRVRALRDTTLPRTLISIQLLELVVSKRKNCGAMDR